MKSSKRKRVGTEESLSSMTSLASKWPLSNATNIMAPPTSSNYQQQMINGGPLSVNYPYSELPKQPAQQPPPMHQLRSSAIQNSCIQPSYLISFSNEHKLPQTEKYLNSSSFAYLSAQQQLNYHLQQQTGSFYLDALHNNATAKNSSYYSLTPASSTTSLNEYAANWEQSKATLIRTESKKRTRGATTEHLLATESSLEANVATANIKKSAKQALPPQTNAVGATVVPKRRGRPPKNATIIAATLLAPINKNKEIEPPIKADEEQLVINVIPSTNMNRSNSCLESTLSTSFSAKQSNKLIKSLISKSSSNSNLQKSKVLTTSSQAVRQQPDENHRPVNNSKSTQPCQSQITGYLVDKLNTTIPPSDNKQEYTALKLAGVELVSKSSSQLEIYEAYYCKAKSVTVSHFGENIHKMENGPTPMPKLSWANNHELWQAMRRKELKYCHDPHYLRRHSNIEPQMRAILLDWLVEISYAYRLHRETWHLALEYMDRFMSCSKQQMRIDRLQLIGMTSLFLAAKVEEIYPPKLKELASHMENYSNNNEDAISQFELFMLKSLNWQISPVTANTWLMTYLQIASINGAATGQCSEQLTTQMVMPLNVYKNSNANKMNVAPAQQQFYLRNYMKSVTLLDLCMFDMESLKFGYSILAASAMYHMVSGPDANSTQFAASIVQLSTGYQLHELDACVKWMYPYADVCKDILTEEKMCQIKTFSSVEYEDAHNIQLYHQNLELMKEAQSRKTPCKFYVNSSQHMQVMLTPPDSQRKFSSSSSNYSVSDSLLSTSILSSDHLCNAVNKP